MKTDALILWVFLGTSCAYGDELIGQRGSQLAPPPMWAGFYAGLNAGNLWTNGNAPTNIDWSRLTAVGDFAYVASFASVPQSGFTWTTGPGFVGGGQVGYNWQVTDKIVVGLETDFQGVAGGGSNWNTGWTSGSPSIKGPSTIGSVRGRAGYLAAPNLQIYGTGGLSYGGRN